MKRRAFLTAMFGATLAAPMMAKPAPCAAVPDRITASGWAYRLEGETFYVSAIPPADPWRHDVSRGWQPSRP